MTYDGSDFEDHDDPKGQGQPPPYSESASDVPSTERAATTTTMHSSTSTAVGFGAGVTVVTAQPTYPAYPTAVVYQGNLNYVPAVNVGQGPFIGPKESPMTCPSCQQRITTKVEYKATMRTHVCALAFCMVGLLPCMIIPYCVKGCRNADHYCPECNAFLGTYMRV